MSQLSARIGLTRASTENIGNLDVTLQRIEHAQGELRALIEWNRLDEAMATSTRLANLATMATGIIEKIVREGYQTK